MPLVEYSESETEEDLKVGRTADQESKKRKRNDVEHTEDIQSKSPPPLPSSFHSLYATNVRTSTSDDPSLHSGRKRQTPHMPGNWPTHVYLEWVPSKEQLSILDHSILKVKKNLPSDGESKVHSFLHSELGVQLPLHVSLSAPLVLSTERKDELRSSLIDALRSSSLESFEVTPSVLKWVSNFEQTRYFLILGLNQPPGDALNELLQLCNGIAAQHGLPTLYTKGERMTVGVPKGAHHRSETDADGHEKLKQSSQEPARSQHFHISIAWTLERPHSVDVPLEVAACDNILHNQLKIHFNAVKLKIGNVVDEIALSSK